MQWGALRRSTMLRRLSKSITSPRYATHPLKRVCPGCAATAFNGGSVAETVSTPLDLEQLHNSAAAITP